MSASIFIAILSILLAFPPSLSAAEKESDVDVILDKFVRAIGGKEAWNKLETRRIKADMEVLGATSEWISEAKAPNKQTSRVKLSTLGLMEDGFDGTIAWSKNKTGVKVRDGGELERVKKQAEFRRELHLKELYSGLKSGGLEMVNGEEVRVLVSNDPQAGRQRFYFSRQTGLMVCEQSEFANGTGNRMTVNVFYSDYREVDGVKYPHHQEVKIRMGGQQVFESKMTVKEIKHNEKIDDSRFAKPSA